MQDANTLSEDLNSILLQTSSLWEEFRDNRLFITGGTGFIGCWLLESFLWANKQLNLNSEVVVLSRDPESFSKKYPYLACQPALHFHKGDVKNFTYPSGRFTHIIHAATEVSAAQSLNDALLMFDTIVQGTKHTLEFSRNCGAQKILFVSSGAVYGKQPATLSHIAEDHACQLNNFDPGSSYAAGKQTAEYLCSLYANQYALNIKIARCFAFIGPYLSLKSHHAAGNFIRDALAGKTIVIEGDGTPLRSYLYASDLAVWLWNILCRGESLRPYNVGSDNAVTIRQVAQMISDAFEQKHAIKLIKSPVQGAMSERYVPDVNRVKRELNLAAQMNLEQAIQATCRWFTIGDHTCR